MFERNNLKREFKLNILEYIHMFEQYLDPALLGAPCAALCFQTDFRQSTNDQNRYDRCGYLKTLYFYYLII